MIGSQPKFARTKNTRSMFEKKVEQNEKMRNKLEQNEKMRNKFHEFSNNELFIKILRNFKSVPL